MALSAGSSASSALQGSWPLELRRDLVRYWPLHGDTQDYSDHGNHGIAHNSGAMDGAFNGRDAFIQIPPSAFLQLGQGDFTLSA